MMLFGAMAVVGSGKIKASTVADLGFLHESVGYCLFSLEFSFVAFIQFLSVDQRWGRKLLILRALGVFAFVDFACSGQLDLHWGHYYEDEIKVQKSYITLRVDSEHAMAEVDNVEDDDDLWKKLWWLPNMLSRKKEAICSSLLNSVSKSYFVKTNGRLSSSVLSCLIEKKMSDSWSPLDPSTFKVRGHNYLKDKKKECASNQAAYYPIGVDVFLSPHKIDPIARLLELPKVESSGKIRHLLVVNLQIPLYPLHYFKMNMTEKE
ncbi:uncharacterized protein LOC110939790 isoform X2 [Helianthus annuus]|uniref:uncharacterized protein LOC110939790 isoform X2 n=1 Tax=Helianthus annuus TaxID=4232 RepID=UPI000B907277|nr:uncharacterized protein LOC110939790 isoform X2 [Helianthus annuus]